jgi:hypothetical protein
VRNNNDGDISITKTSIVGKEQGGFILENYNLTGSSEGIVQMLVTAWTEPPGAAMPAISISYG